MSATPRPSTSVGFAFHPFQGVFTVLVGTKIQVAQVEGIFETKYVVLVSGLPLGCG